jgi:hypothetical protein
MAGALASVSSAMPGGCPPEAESGAVHPVVEPHLPSGAGPADGPRAHGQQKAVHSALCTMQEILESGECEVQLLQRRQQEIVAAFLKEQKLLNSSFNRMVEDMPCPPWPAAERASGT